MYEFLGGLHRALHIESTWKFVALVGLLGGLLCSGVAWVIDAAYKNSDEFRRAHTSAPKAPSATVDNNPLARVLPSSSEIRPQSTVSGPKEQTHHANAKQGSTQKERQKIEQHSEAENSPNIGNLQQGPCSSAVMGGTNNSATTNCVPPSRVPAEGETKAFSADLSLSKGTVILIKAGSGGDIEALFDWFLRTVNSVPGWKARELVIRLPRPILDKGLKCYSANWLSDSGESFKTALSRTKLKCEIKEGEYQPFSDEGVSLDGGNVNVVIGESP